MDNWDNKKKVVMRYQVNPDGTLSNRRVFFDMTSAPGEDALDGMKIDKKGHPRCLRAGWAVDLIRGQAPGNDR